MPDGTLKDLGKTGDINIDIKLQKISNKAQSRNFKIHNGVPSASDGEVGNIWIVNDSGSFYLYVKVDNSTWKRTSLV